MTLRALSREKARYESGTFDLRNWEVRVRSGDQRIGVVDDVLIDDRGHTRYLDVALDDTDRHVLVPPGQMEADGTEEVIRVSGIRRDQLSGLPEYGHDPSSVDSDYERRIDTALDGGESRDDHDDYYDRPDYTTSWGRGRDTAGNGKLAPLDRLDDVDVAKGDTDPRGFDTVGSDGQKVGKVRDLIGDVDAMKVRYLTLELDRKLGEGQVLVPVGHAHIDPNERRVRVPAIDRERILALPRYDGNEISHELERQVTSFFAEAYGEDRRYDHSRFRYDRLYGENQSFAEDELPDETALGVVVVRRWYLDDERTKQNGPKASRNASKPGSRTD
jgi:hypothetical protein